MNGGRKAIAGYIVAAVIALAMSALYLQVSSAIGRLSQDLQPDDVGYALECAFRADVLATQGIAATLATFLDRPAHSYLATLQGMAAFLLLGTRDFSLYASNAWLLVAIALGLAYALRDRAVATRLVVLLFILTAPICYFAINEFRPDIALALATAIAAWALLEVGFHRHPRLWVLAGIAIGFALVAKQTFFAHTLAITGAVAGAGMLSTWIAPARWRAAFSIDGGTLLRVAVLAVAIALPFYGLNAHHVFEYFWTNTFGSAGQVWNYGSQLSTREVIHEFRPVAFMLDRYQAMAAIAVALACSIALWRRGERSPAALTWALFAVAALSVAIIVAGRQPSPFFFATADWLVMLAAVHAFVAWADGVAAVHRRIVSMAALVAIAGLASANSAVPPWPAATGVEHGASLNEALIRRIAQDRAGSGAAPASPPSVMVLSAGTVNPATLAWVGRMMGYPVNVPPTSVLGDIDEVRRDVEKFDYVEVPNPIANSGGGHLPVAKLWAPMLESMIANPRFETLTPLDGHWPSYLFARRARKA